MSDKTPEERVAAPPRTTAPGWFLLPLPVLLLWGWLLWQTPENLLVPVLATGGAALALLLACAVLLARRDRTAGELRAQVEAASARATALAEEDLPGVITRLRQGESARRILHSLDRSGDPSGRAVLDLVVSEIADAEQRRAATVTACATAAGRIQAMTTTMLADLRRMQDRYGDGTGGGDVLGDLMHLDHTVAQTGRTADSIAVLTGARSGRRWARAIPLESIVRGAMGRIGDYRRVRLHHVPSQAIAGFAAEGTIHALAELLDNAAKFSPPTAEVHVHLEEVQAGIAVMVEDGGLTMGEEALRRARGAVGRGVDIGAISGTRLGLSVVGIIAGRYGLSVSFRPSSRGGTAVVLLLPRTLVKPLSERTVRPGAPAPPVPATEPDRTLPAAAEPTEPATPRTTERVPDPEAEGADTPPRHASGLPMRRRGQTLHAAQRSAPERAAPRPKTQAQGFGAFRSAVRGQDPTGTPKDG